MFMIPALQKFSFPYLGPCENEKTIVSREAHNAKRRDFNRYIGKDLYIPTILVLLAYYLALCVYGETLRKSTIRSLIRQPTQLSAKLLSAQANYGDKYQACSSRVLQLSNSAEILPKVASSSSNVISNRALILDASLLLLPMNDALLVAISHRGSAKAAHRCRFC